MPAPGGRNARTSAVLPPLLYVLGVAWVLLYPVLNVSTGELKCRGTFFSENALIARSSKPLIAADQVRFCARQTILL